VECGHCAWGKAPNGFCGKCKTKIRARPLQEDALAFWVQLSPKEKASQKAREEARVHKGTTGYFGRDGRENHLDPFKFRGVGCLADFDDMKTLNLSDLLRKPRLLPRNNELWITICPASVNYSGFPEVFGKRKTIIGTLGRDAFFEDFNGDDVLILENKAFRESFEVRLIGWREHLALDAS